MTFKHTLRQCVHTYSLQVLTCHWACTALSYFRFLISHMYEDFNHWGLKIKIERWKCTGHVLKFSNNEWWFYINCYTRILGGGEWTCSHPLTPLLTMTEKSYAYMEMFPVIHTLTHHRHTCTHKHTDLFLFQDVGFYVCPLLVWDSRVSGRWAVAYKGPEPKPQYSHHTYNHNHHTWSLNKNTLAKYWGLAILTEALEHYRRAHNV